MNKYLGKEIYLQKKKKIYQKIINLTNNTPNQSSKFRTRNWVEIDDESQETCNVSKQIKFKTSSIRLNLCNYSDAQIHVKGTISVQNNGTTAPDNRNRKIIFEDCAPFTNFIRKIIHANADADDIDVVMVMYNLIEYSDIYTKKTGNLWH